jgi:hypothetical protein
MKTYYSKKNRPFRLSGTTREDSGVYTTVIKWLDTNEFETFPHKLIEPYLK